MDRRQFLGGAISGATAFAKSRAEQTKGEVQVAAYAIVEQMGYKKLCGRIQQGQFGLIQIDIPVEGGIVTKMINPESIYAITYVDEATVRHYAQHVDPLPAIELEIQPRQRSLAWNDRDDDDDDRF